MRFSGSATKRKPFPSRGVVPSLNAGTAPHSDSIPPFPGGKRELTWSRMASFSYKLLRDSVFRSCVVPTTTNSIFLEILNRFQRPYETKKKNPVVQMEKLNHKDQITNKPAQSQLQSLGVERQAWAWLEMQVTSSHQLHEVCITSPDDNKEGAAFHHRITAVCFSYPPLPSNKIVSAAKKSSPLQNNLQHLFVFVLNPPFS